MRTGYAGYDGGQEIGVAVCGGLPRRLLCLAASADGAALAASGADRMGLPLMPSASVYAQALLCACVPGICCYPRREPSVCGRGLKTVL